MIRSCVICHGGPHASGICLNGNLHTRCIVSSDHLCMTIIALRERRLCLFASSALTRIMPLCNGVCLISAVVGIAIRVPCCLDRVTAAHFVFGHLWISFTGVRSMGCGDSSFVNGCRKGVLNMLHCNCYRCHFPKIVMWMPVSIPFSNRSCGSRSTT